MQAQGDVIGLSVPGRADGVSMCCEAVAGARRPQRGGSGSHAPYALHVHAHVVCMYGSVDAMLVGQDVGMSGERLGHLDRS